MSLSSDLLSQFAKATNDSKKKNTEATVCGTVRSKDGKLYVQIDGSDLLTPTESTVDKLPGERVMVQIKDHVATVIGNYTSPAARTEDVQKLIVDTEKIDRIEADNVQINERLEAAEGIIKDLDTDYLTADEADIKYANIDFSNIKMAAVEKLFTKSGIIENLVVGDTSITGELVGVTIKGDLIEGNTIAAEKLVVKGEDGLYYKLNLDGETVEAQQTNYNSLNGSIITAKSITASKINVTDLVAFGATIGGFKLSQNSIYSGSKSSVSNTTSGIYLDKDGQLVVGDSTNFLKYYKDQNGNYKLEISANSMKLSSSNKDVETTLNEISNATQTNTNDLTNYITATNKELESLQGQIDGSIATWFYEYVPTNTNYPASGWTTTDLKNNHLGDLFYDTITGYCYRWQVQNNTYSWNRITDVDVTKALADAAAAQDTADKKRRVFVTTPTVPYDVGDLWVQGTSGDIMRCQTKKTSSQSYASADWVKASKYTDDTKANAAQTTANTANTKIDNLEIGGRNILRNTKSLVGSNITGDATITGEKYKDFATRRFDNSSSTSGYKDIIRFGEIYAEKLGDEYTLSFYAKGSGVNKLITYFYGDTGYIKCVKSVQSDGTVKTYSDGSDGNTSWTLTENWQRYWVTWTLSDTGDITVSKTVLFRVYYGGVAEICGVKLEKGNKPTDWTPAPEDLEAGITENKSSITQLSNKITTNVTSINNLTTRMTTVEQTSNDITVRIDTLESDNSIVTGSVIGFSGDTIPEGYEEVEIENVTNYMNFSSAGLVIGDMKASTLGNNVLIDSDSVDIRKNTSTLASFGANTIYLGKNSTTSVINLCNNSALMQVVNNTDFKIHTDKRLLLNGTTGVVIGEDTSYVSSLTLGQTTTKNRTINCYWSDGSLHDLLASVTDGSTSYFGPADITNLSSTTILRGKTVRIYNHAGGGVYLGSSGSTAITSDKNMKKDVIDIDDKYINFFDKLRPITYKYNNGHRDHIGFIAQEVEEALLDSGLTTEQFAGLVIEKDVTLNPNYDSHLSDEDNSKNETHYDELYSLRYEEFISLLVKKVQDLQKQIDELKGE